MWRLSAARKFQTDRPATENTHSPNLVKVDATIYENVSVDMRHIARLLWTLVYI